MPNLDRDDLKIVGSFAGAIILLIAVLFFILANKEIQVRVVGHTWTREIRVEDFQTRNYSGWDETVPEDAREVACWRELRSTSTSCVAYNEDHVCTMRVTNHHYDNKCSYVADRWTYLRSLMSNGNSREDSPYWEAIDFETCPELGCERENGRNQVYWVMLEDIENGFRFNCAFEQDTWAGHFVGNEYTITVRRFYNWQFCDSLKAIAG